MQKFDSLDYSGKSIYFLQYIKIVWYVIWT